MKEKTHSWFMLTNTPISVGMVPTKEFPLKPLQERRRKKKKK